MRLNVKLTLIILSIGLLSLGIAGVLYQLSAEEAIDSQVVNQLESVASIQKSRIESILAQNLERLVLVASRTQLRISLRDYNSDPQTGFQDRMNGIMADAKSSVSDFKDISIANLDGQIVASTNPDYIGTDEFNSVFFENGLAGNRVDLLFLDENNNLNVHLTGPLFLDEELLGVIVIEATVDNIIAAVTDYTGLGETGETFLVSRNVEGDVLFLTPLRFDSNAALLKVASGNNLENVAVQALLDNPDSLVELVDYRDEPVLAATRLLPETGWGLAAKIDRSEAFAPVIELRSSIIFISLGAILLIGLAAVYVARTITRPIASLTQVAQKITQGDLGQRAEIKSKDEIGLLAEAFNKMADQLDLSFSTLEQQVHARTQRLETVALLSEQLNTILDLDQLLIEVVNQIRETFSYYHVHIYLLDEASQELVMEAGYGQAGAKMKATGHSIPMDALTSLVARAARSGNIVTVDNVRDAADWLPNPLLPNTYSEMAVPVIVEGNVVGVLDVQQDKIAGLDESDANLLRSLASQVAVAIRNARLFNEVETSLSEAQALQARYLEQAWERRKIARQNVGQGRFNLNETVSLDENQISAARQKATAATAGTLMPVDTGEKRPGEDNRRSLVAPLRLRDVTIGNIQLHGLEPGRSLTDSERAFFESVIDQVAQAAENIRLLSNSREQASREQLVGQISDKLRRAPDFETLMRTGVEELSRVLGPTRTFVQLGLTETALQEQKTSEDDPTGNEAALPSATIIPKPSTPGSGSTNGRGEHS